MRCSSETISLADDRCWTNAVMPKTSTDRAEEPGATL